jgi:aspartate/methionine/tyrosine aminotransferase
MPDFEPPAELISAAINALRNGYNQYPITWGQQNLREAVARKAKEYNGIDSDAEKSVTITCGSTEAVAAAILALTDPDDAIVITDPFYENYVPDAILAGADPVYVPFEGEELRLDPERLKSVMERRPRVMIINTPNNPTGRVFERSELKLIADLCEEFNCVAITDEIYEHIIYDKPHISLATIGNMHERTVTVSGASKTYSVTGWRVGWAIAEETMSNAIRKVHDYLTIGAATPLQEALVTALEFPLSYYNNLVSSYRKKRDLLVNVLEDSNIAFHEPEGAYYILADAPPQFKDGQEFAHVMLEEAKIAVLPALALYNDKKLGERKVRLAFCKKDETLQEVEHRLSNFKI